ncbi:MAG: ATP-binding protein [Phaeodactylibacter sp.]|nr:ATP-binding protein [Phaeodactylibacter sp.]
MPMHNATHLQTAFHYLAQAVRLRLQAHFSKGETLFSLPVYDDEGSKAFLDQAVGFQLKDEERVVLLLALVPHAVPNFFEKIILEALPKSGDFPELGGVKGKHHRGMIPTGDTVLFLLGGDELGQRLEVGKVLEAVHPFNQRKILYLEGVREGEPSMSGRLILDEEYVQLLLKGYVSVPKLSAQFPAQYISTQLEWEGLVLPHKTLHQIQELKHWVNYNDTLLYDWDMHKKIKPGYRALFYGPPGTGKTLTATLLGKYTSKEVFRIDLSLVVSKYIGETEKNLANLFDKAQNKNWILFFDEADALFGKRTDVRDAHDKYANQEVAYLLQRVENYPGLVILSSNYRSNIDDAFTRRFNSIIHFPLPNSQDRFRLWAQAFPQKVALSRDVDLEFLSQHYELTGANIINIVQYACLYSLAQERDSISMDLIQRGIKKEFSKEGKVY